ncbi:MAG TPA: hypothetical protein VK212_05145 [Lentimicrobium sp.]|nr:hypothetical protein [Lentimicrobium sp.]
MSEETQVSAKISKYIKIQKLVPVFLVIQVIFYFFGLYGRMPDIDDAWIGEHAYWMAETGHAKSELMRGWQHQEERILIHHKLMTLTGFLVIKSLGFSLYGLKSVSLLFFGLFLLTFYYYGRKNPGKLTRDQFMLSLLIFFLFHYTFKFSFIFRPEIIIMFFTFTSYILLEKGLNDNNNENDGTKIPLPVGERNEMKPNHQEMYQVKGKIANRRSQWIYFFIAGILSGLCGVAHLNGLAVALAGSTLLLLNKKARVLPIFVFGSILGFSLYFYDFSRQYGFPFWKQQLFQSVLGTNGGTNDVIRYMTNSFLKEHMRFFHDLSIIGFSLLLILVLLAGYKYLLKTRRTMLQYSLILWLIVAFLFTQKSRQYILIYLPFLVIFITTVLDKFLKGETGLKDWIYSLTGRIVLFLTVTVFLIGSTLFNIKVSSKKFNPIDNRNFVMNHIGNDVSSLKIVAPMEFIFNEIVHFKSIQGERLYTTLQHSDSTIYGEGFFRKASDFDVDYILLSGVYRENLGVTSLDNNKIYSGYKLLLDTGELSLYKRLGSTERSNASE